jgi:hypothetical protein
MPDFDPSRLTDPERSAYLAHLECAGPGDVDSRFAIVIWWVGMLRDMGKKPEEIAETIGGEYRDPDRAMVPGPTIRYVTLTLTRAMVRQALELEPWESTRPAFE